MRPRQGNPRCSPGGRSWVEAPAPQLSGPSCQSSKGKPFGFTRLAVGGKRRHMRREKFIVSHKADLLFGKMNGGNPQFPTWTLHCRQVSPCLGRSAAQGPTSQAARARGAAPASSVAHLSGSLSRSPRTRTSSSASRPLLYPETLGGGPVHPTTVNFVSDKKKPWLG